MAAACTVCDYSHNNTMLGFLFPNSSAFAQEWTSSRAFLVSFVWSSSTMFLKPRCLPIDKRNATYDGSPHESGTVHLIWNSNRVPCCSWCPRNSANMELLSFCFQTIPQTPWKFSWKVLRSLIFAVRDESVKTTKIMCLENWCYKESMFIVGGASIACIVSHCCPTFIVFGIMQKYWRRLLVLLDTSI